MNILITGGAGYIGSYISKKLNPIANLIIIDNLSTGNKWAIPKKSTFYEGDVGDVNLLDCIFSEHKIDAVIHVAASISVGESVGNPYKYYRNNSFNTLTLLQKCGEYKINRLIFSSTAAVYGQPNLYTISEDTVLNPINPYGNSKMMDEKMIQDFTNSVVGKDINFKYVILRYFNVAGAAIDGSLGQDHKGSNHLITLVAKTALGKLNKLTVLGTDYPTKDGTCIRDYIHVEDLADAHVVALKSLDKEKSNIYNCGYGEGFSVLEVLDMMKKVSGSQFKIESASKREGDPAKLVADSTKLKTKLNWKPKHNLETICESAYLWEKFGPSPIDKDKKLNSGKLN